MRYPAPVMSAFKLAQPEEVTSSACQEPYMGSQRIPGSKHGISENVRNIMQNSVVKMPNNFQIHIKEVVINNEAFFSLAQSRKTCFTKSDLMSSGWKK